MVAEQKQINLKFLLEVELQNLTNNFCLIKLGRSQWKNPHYLLKQFKKNFLMLKKERSLIIFDKSAHFFYFKDLYKSTKKVFIYKGHFFLRLFPTKFINLLKVGEFCLTRRFYTYKQKK